MTINREIGSEFHTFYCGTGDGLRCLSNGVLTFSGRTAIDMVINCNRLKHVLLPSYCCDSIIEPFRSAGIQYSFYDVNFTDQLIIDYNIPSGVNAIFLCNYFGFKTSFPDLREFIKRGGIIIEDITHSFFSDTACHKQSHYLIASLRKWEPVLSGGFCKGKNIVDNLTRPPSSFLEKRKNAMDLKREYLFDLDEKKKPVFLSDFRECNQWLETHYHNLSIDELSKEYLMHVDVKSHCNRRKENAKVLYDGLSGKVEFMFSEKEMDCPLFVPIIIRKGRNKIRDSLINEKIYCPIHWPAPKECCSNLYDLELSLVCDQRYDAEDMKRIVSAIERSLLDIDIKD